MRTGGIFYFPWHRHQIEFTGLTAFSVSSERHWQCGVNGIAKVPKRSCPQWDSNPSRTVRSPQKLHQMPPKLRKMKPKLRQMPPKRYRAEDSTRVLLSISFFDDTPVSLECEYCFAIKVFASTVASLRANSNGSCYLF